MTVLEIQKVFKQEVPPIRAFGELSQRPKFPPIIVTLFPPAARLLFGTMPVIVGWAYLKDLSSNPLLFKACENTFSLSPTFSSTSRRSPVPGATVHDKAVSEVQWTAAQSVRTSLLYAI